MIDFYLFSKICITKTKKQSYYTIELQITFYFKFCAFCKVKFNTFIIS